VFFSVSSDKKDSALEAFRKASVFLRKELGHHLQLRYTPQISFYYDDSIDHAEKMMSLFAKISAEKGDSS
jgi:ribosome-binding factor A